MKVQSGSVVSILLSLMGTKPGGAEKQASKSPFRRVSSREAEQVLGNGVAFNHSWLLREHGPDQLGEFPDALPPPSFVQIYAYDSLACGGAGNQDNSTTFHCSDLSELGSIASKMIDIHLGETGAMLFRNLPLANPRDFRIFFDGVQWPTVKYVPYASDRPQVEGIDLATNIPSHYALGLHNEMAYSPKPASKIAFYCNQPAWHGGETILAYNKQLTAKIPRGMKDFVHQVGGVLYTRRHFDAAGSLGPDFSQMRMSSWQSKCHGTTQEEALQFFADMGFDRQDMGFNHEGTLTVRYRHSGFVQEGEEEVWFNVINGMIPTTPDETPFPDDFVDELEIYYWQTASAFKLQGNDWLVLDNKRVMHGRLPYSTQQGPERQLLTVYSA